MSRKVDLRTNYERQTDEYMKVINGAIGANQYKQKDIARLIGKTPSTVSRHLADIDSVPLGELRRLTAVLGLSVRIEEGEKQ